MKPGIDEATGLNLSTEFDIYVDVHGVFDDGTQAGWIPVQHAHIVEELRRHGIRVRLLSFVGIDGWREAQVREKLDFFFRETGCSVELEFTDQHQGLPFVREDLPLSHPHRTSTGGKDYQCLVNHVPVLIDDGINNIRGARDIGVKCYFIGDSAYADFETAARALISDVARRRKPFLDFFLKQPTEASPAEKRGHIRKSHATLNKLDCYNCGRSGHRACDCSQPQKPRRR